MLFARSRKSRMTQPKALLEWSLDVECPACAGTVDLTSNDDGAIGAAIFSNDWKQLDNHEVACPFCKNKFTISGVEC